MPEPETTSELWRWHETHPVAAFFDTWIQKFRTLEWTVNPFDAEDGMMLRWDRMTDVTDAHSLDTCCARC